MNCMHIPNEGIFDNVSGVRVSMQNCVHLGSFCKYLYRVCTNMNDPYTL